MELNIIIIYGWCRVETRRIGNRVKILGGPTTVTGERSALLATAREGSAD